MSVSLLITAGVALIAAAVGALAPGAPVVVLPALLVGAVLVGTGYWFGNRELTPLGVTASEGHDASHKARAYFVVKNPLPRAAKSCWGQLLAICHEADEEWTRLPGRQLNLAWSPLHTDGKQGCKSTDITGSGARAELNVVEAFGKNFALITAPSTEGHSLPAQGRYVFRVSIHADGRRSHREDFLLTVLEEGGDVELDLVGGFVAYHPPEIRFDVLPPSLTDEVRPLLSDDYGKHPTYKPFTT